MWLQTKNAKQIVHNSQISIEHASQSVHREFTTNLIIVSAAQITAQHTLLQQQEERQHRSVLVRAHLVLFLTTDNAFQIVVPGLMITELVQMRAAHKYLLLWMGLTCAKPHVQHSQFSRVTANKCALHRAIQLSTTQKEVLVLQHVLHRM